MSLRYIFPQILFSRCLSWAGWRRNRMAYSRQAAGEVGRLQICVVLSSCRVLSNTPSMRLSCQKAKDGDVLMHACQKITAQLFSAKSHTGMAGEKLNETQKLRRRKREWGSNKHRSVTESLFVFQNDVCGMLKKRFSQKVWIENTHQNKSWMKCDLCCFVYSANLPIITY